MNELICAPVIVESFEVQKVRVLPEFAIVCTKNSRSYSFNVLSSSDHVDEITIAEMERQASNVVAFLKKTLPKKLYRAVYMQIAREVSKVKWKDKQKKREKSNTRKKKAQEPESSWKDTVPDSFSSI